MDGLLLVDKPAGWTSHDVAAYVKRATGVKRVGHTGTLDPDATGLVIVLVGRATRLAKFFEHDDKAYSAVLRLGSETDTQDATGTTIKECDVPAVDAAMVESVFAKFTGELSQLPPMYSAVKVDGRRLYKSARAGVEVERKTRTVTIHSLTLNGMDGADIGFDAVCSKGTYIRTLCRDIAESLGSCGHMASLRRTGAGGHSVDGAIRLADRPAGEQILAALIPADDMLPGLMTVIADSAVAARIMNGSAPFADELELPGGAPAHGETLKIKSLDGSLLAVAEARADQSGGRVLLKLEIVFN